MSPCARPAGGGLPGAMLLIIGLIPRKLKSGSPMWYFVHADRELDGLALAARSMSRFFVVFGCVEDLLGEDHGFARVAALDLQDPVAGRRPAFSRCEFF
jgi:hypothetical protein